LIDGLVDSRTYKKKKKKKNARHLITYKKKKKIVVVSPAIDDGKGDGNEMKTGCGCDS
jgi:hypothetical protein